MTTTTATLTWSNGLTSVYGPASTDRMTEHLLRGLVIDPGLTVSFLATKEDVDTLWDEIGHQLDNGPEVSHDLDRRIESQFEWIGDIYEQVTSLPADEQPLDYGWIHRGLLVVKAAIHAERKG